jgi:hypothetical protein
MITPNPRCFGVWGVIGKRVEVENPNGVSAKCAINTGLGGGAARGGKTALRMQFIL